VDECQGNSTLFLESRYFFPDQFLSALQVCKRFFFCSTLSEFGNFVLCDLKNNIFLLLLNNTVIIKLFFIG
jgi:hypothetical protein